MTMEKKTSGENFLKSPYLPLMVTGLAFTGVVIHTSSQNKKLSQEISMLKTEIKEMRDERETIIKSIKDHDYKLKRIIADLYQQPPPHPNQVRPEPKKERNVPKKESKKQEKKESSSSKKVKIEDITEVEPEAENEVETEEVNEEVLSKELASQHVE